MIKIKVFSIRQATNILTICFVIAILTVFTFFILVTSLFFIKETITDELLSNNNLMTEKTFSNETLIDNILKKELLFLSIADIDDKAEIKEQGEIDDNVLKIEQSENKLENRNNNNENNSNKIDVEINKVNNNYSIPEKYEVELLSSGKVKVGNTTIVNYSKLNLDVNELSKPSDIRISQNTNFLIFHTHATESYTFPDNPNIDNYRTTDKNYNMISIGKHLFDNLTKKGFSCLHDDSLHDHPSYNGAYKSSLATVTKYLKDCKYDFVIDIHRDALSSNLNFRPTAEINGESAAKLMFVIGTNSSGLSHDKWLENLKLALMIQNRANEMYPGLFRDLHLSNSRYNQHVASGAFIIEVGATGNTLEEAKNAMKYLASVIDSFK